MDPLSQALLGGLVAEVASAGKLGRRAFWWGAAAGAFPDIDVVFGWFGDEISHLRWHRGITHALIFAPLFGSVLAWWCWRRGRARGRAESLWTWLAVFVLALWSHALLDACTPYGTQLLLPFSDARVAWHVVPVVEPVYTLLLLLGVVGIRVLPRRAATASMVALALSCGYLYWGWGINQQAVEQARVALEQRGVKSLRIHSFPTFFQMPLRRVVAYSEDELWVSHFVPASNASLSGQDCPIQWRRAPRSQHPAFESLRATREGQTFYWFADGVVAERVLPGGDGVVAEMSDMRYGREPNAETGLWGVRGVFSENGAQRSEVGMYYGNMGVSLADMLALWRVAYANNGGACESTAVAGLNASAAPRL